MSTTDQPPIVLYFDGLCEANPGGWMSWAWVALARDGAVVANGGKCSPPQPANTNNLAEYFGLLSGLRWLKDHGHAGIRVRGDSQLVVNQVSGRWQVNAVALRPLSVEARGLVAELGVTLEWVPREKNHRADALAREILPPEARAVVEAAVARREGTRGRR